MNLTQARPVVTGQQNLDSEIAQMTVPMYIGRVVSDSRRSSPDYRRLELETGHHITRPHQECRDWLPDLRGHWFRVTPNRFTPEVARFERLTFPMPGKRWKGKILQCHLAGERLRITVGVPDSRIVFQAFAPLAETLGPFAMRHDVAVQADVATCMIGDFVKIRPRDDGAFLADIVYFYVKRRRVRKPKLYLVKPLNNSPNVSTKNQKVSGVPPRAA